MLLFQLRSVALATAGALFVSTAIAPAASLTENFSTNPMRDGWQIFGDTNLFHWDSTNQSLSVTWDSSRSNSYFYFPLGTILDRNDDFAVAFDLRLDDIGAGAEANTFQIAVGFVNLAEATSGSFLRGTGYNSPDLLELDYFWDSGFGTTFWPTIVGDDETFDYNGSSDYSLLTLTNGNWHRISMGYTASNHTLVTFVTNLTAHSGQTITQPLAASFSDFFLTALSISSYSQAGQDPTYAGSVLAHGVIDNISLSVPPPPVQNLLGAFANGAWSVQFDGRTNWLYTLERSTDLHTWAAAAPTAPGIAGRGLLSDTNPPAGIAFYRLQARRP